MWSKVLESRAEQTAFVSLLDEYFERPPPIAPASGPTPSRQPRRALAPQPPTTSSPTRPVAPPVTQAPGGSFSSRMQTAAAGAALRNTTATSSALRQAGLSQSAAQSVAGFGAKHHEALAPHVANAARQGIRMQQQQQQDEGTIKKPTGLQASKSMAGVGDTSSGKNFTKALFSSKGALSKAEQDKNKYTGPLYVKPPTAPGTISHAPPPRRVGAAAAAASVPPPPVPSVAAGGGATGVERVRALYDYEGTEADDLPVVEGEELTVVEPVGDDWLKCRNSQGAEGLLPKNYTERI